MEGTRPLWTSRSCGDCPGRPQVAGPSAWECPAGGEQGCPQGRALIPLATLGVDEPPPQRCAACAVGTHFLTPVASDAGPSGSSPLSLLVTSCPVQLPRGAACPVLFAAVGFQCFSPLPVALEGAQVPAMSLLLDAMSIRPFQGSVTRGPGPGKGFHSGRGHVWTS